MVYRDGLENRFGLTANGGSNPSPSARFMKEYISLIVWAVAIGVAFAFAWKLGYLLRLSNYVDGTREELRKCSWPTRDELKGSTVLVIISVLMIGVFTAVVDFVVISAVRLLI